MSVEWQAAPAFDVLGLGCVAVDDLLYVPSFPLPDSKNRLTKRLRQCGGLTATALVAASRLGARCAYAGVLGHDDDSEFVVANLRREKVDLRYLRSQEGVRPIHATVLVDESSHTRTVLTDLTGTQGATPDWPPEPALRSTRILYVDHYGIEGMLRAAQVCRAAGIAVVADVERDEWPGFHTLLALIDHLIVTQFFATKLTGQRDPAAAADRLWREDRQAVVVTCGGDGSWYRGAGELALPRHQPVYPVEVVDTTGCGDVFHGAYAAALAHGFDLPQRIRFATAAAALKATKTGGQAGSPTRAAVDAFLDSQ